MKNIVILFSILLWSGTLLAQTEEVQIHTSAECGSCKDRLEGKLNYVEGIRFAELDVESKMLTVKFKPSTISLEAIKTIIVELGYDADEMKAKPEAVEKLPACCKPGGMGH
jgi:copper chaperone CopZ